MSSETPAVPARRHLLDAVLHVLVPGGLLLLVAAAGCATTPWPDGEAHGKITSDQPIPGTLFIEPVPATSPCAATRLAVAMGISRRGYYVLARPAELKEAFLVELRCEEWTEDVELWRDQAADAASSCVAPGILHLKIEAELHGTATAATRFPLLTFRGRQRIFPAPISQGCRFDLETQADLRKRAGEAIGWRFPPGQIAEPGADPRVIQQPPARKAP